MQPAQTALRMHLGGGWQAAAPFLKLGCDPQAAQQRRLPRLRAALAQELLRLDLQRRQGAAVSTAGDKAWAPVL